jgi:hypothetical protein
MNGIGQRPLVVSSTALSGAPLRCRIDYGDGGLGHGTVQMSRSGV